MEEKKIKQVSESYFKFLLRAEAQESQILYDMKWKDRVWLF